jgi:hypothetical protein
MKKKYIDGYCTEGFSLIKFHLFLCVDECRQRTRETANEIGNAFKQKSPKPIIVKDLRDFMVIPLGFCMMFFTLPIIIEPFDNRLIFKIL